MPLRNAFYVFALAVVLCPSGMTKPFPKGAGIVCPVRDANLANEYWTDSTGVQHLIWSDSNIRFILIRDQWQYAEPSDGTYDWSYLDQGLNLARSYATPIVISVDGAQAPQWLYNEGVLQWSSSQTQATAPYPWSGTLQAKWSAFISAMGARYDGYNLVRAVTMWAGGTGIECFFARNGTDDQKLDSIAGGGAGSGAVFWENAAKTLIGYYSSAFPTTNLYLATGQNYAGDQQGSMTDLANWFVSQKPYHYGLQSNALSSTYPAFNSSYNYYPFPHTTLNCADVYIIMYQYVSPIGKMSGSPTNKQVMQNAYNANGWAVQCYPNDPSYDDEAGVIWFNQQYGL